MIRYLLRRSVYGLTVLFGVVTLVFFLFNLKSGDPSRLLGGQHADSTTLSNIRRDLGLDHSLTVRYALYLNDLSPLSWHNIQNPRSTGYLDSARYTYTKLFNAGTGAIVIKWPHLRRSYQSGRNVGSIITDAIPGTILLATTAMFFAFVGGILLGVAAAVRQNRFTDRFILFFSVIGMSGPSFFIAIIVAWLGGYVWSQTFNLPVIPVVVCVFWTVLSWFFFKKEKRSVDDVLGNIVVGLLLGTAIQVAFSFTGYSLAFALPGTGLKMTGSLYSIDPFEGRVLTLSNLILPAFTLALRPLAVIVQLTRSSLLEVMEQDYIRTARAKGLTNRSVLFRHALPNALNPVITAASGWLAAMLAGAVFIEYIFGWKGLGLEVFEALERDDLPVVIGAVLFFATVFVIINILVDWIYGWLDPRVRYT